MTVPIITEPRELSAEDYRGLFACHMTNTQNYKTRLIAKLAPLLALVACGSVQGPPGPPGATGAVTVTERIHCAETREDTLAYMTRTTWHYDSATQTDLRIVSCAIEDDLATYGRTVLYGPNDEGYVSGECTFSYNLYGTANGHGKIACAPTGCTFSDNVILPTPHVFSFVFSACTH